MNLSFNQLGSKEVQVLADALCKNSTLISLDVFENECNFEHIKLLKSALSKNSGNGTEKNENYALSVPKFLEECNKNSDALKVYKLLYCETKDSDIKKEAFLKINELQIKKINF